jgi:hypothetical protein
LHTLNRSLILALAAGALALPATAAKPVRAPQPVETGLGGMWTVESKSGADLPLTDAGLKIQAAQLAGTGPALPGAAAPVTCKPLGMPAMMVGDYAVEFLETPGRVTVINEASPLVRTIYLTEAAHAADMEPSFNGHSIGRWEMHGKIRALVIDTVGLNDRAGVMTGFGVHSSTTHVTERLHLEAKGQKLVDEMTFEDPRFLTKAWTGVVRYKRLPPGSELWEHPCEAGVTIGPSRLSGDPGGRANR